MSVSGLAVFELTASISFLVERLPSATMDQQALVQQLLEQRVYEAARAAEDAVDDELHKMENMTQARWHTPKFAILYASGLAAPGGALQHLGRGKKTSGERLGALGAAAADRRSRLAA